VSTSELLSIGIFAVASGLSVNALRHYDEIGLLKPASVDPATGYRRYQPDQLQQARLIRALRQVDMPIESVAHALRGPEGLASALRDHHEALADRAAKLAALIAAMDRYVKEGITMTDLKAPRIVQVTINVTDLESTVTFYTDALGATFNSDISSFTFGSWPSEDFFLLTMAHDANEKGARPGPAGHSRFGLLVADVDAAHAKALAAGATEHYPPVDRPWRPRSSCVIDPSGNWIDLTQA
jgi:DNA-binding transcriptional MerR regulator